MAGLGDAVSVHEAGKLLSVSARRVEQLAAAGALTRVAPGLLDLASLHHYIADRQGRSGVRVWSTETAWAAIALLSGENAEWLGKAQLSRLRTRLGTLDAAELVAMTRNRATVHRFAGHRSAAVRLLDDMVVTVYRSLGVVAVGKDGGADGYLAADDLDLITTRYALRADAAGPYVLRATTFDIDTVASIAAADDTLFAIDVATAIAPRDRTAALQLLTAKLEMLRAQHE